VNTERDHDAISMEPILAWLPRRPGMSAQTSWVRHVVYTFSELIVALQGTFVHATRWKAASYGAPWWMCVAPLLFVLRVLSYYAFLPPLFATLTLFATMTPAGYVFATLAHLTHDHVSHTESKCVVERQLRNTRDIEPLGCTGEMTLFLDRQCAHHLFPTIDHRRLSRELILFTRSLTTRRS
jgi:fatty acid desaturase